MDLLWKVGSKAKEMLSQKDADATNEKPEENKDEGSSSFVAGLRNEKPVSSLSLETQQGNSDREASSESEGVESEHSIATPMSKESDRTFEEVEGSEKSIKMGISAGDIKDVSHKAVESAKSIGSFLYGIAKKTGGTITETAKQLKTTVEEHSILGDFNKEQEAFVTSKSVEEDNCPPPWSGSDDEENLKQQILSLSADKRNFLRSPPAGVKFDFNFETMYPVAKTMLKEDPALEKMRFEIVPKLINEEDFWKNYFYRIQLVKNSSRLSKIANKKAGNGDSSAGSSSEDSIKDKTTADADPDSDATCSPNHEFVSDSFQASRVSEEDIKHGMQMLGVSDKTTKDDEWEREMQQELQEYEVVAEGNEDDADWENEIDEMLDDKIKDIV